MAANNIMEQNYVSLGHPSAFSAPGNIKRSSQSSDTVATIGKALQSVDAYTLHREYHKPRTKNPFFLYEKRQQLQMDLIDVSEFSTANDGVTFLLVAIDGFTKYAWVRPIVRKTARSSLAAIQFILTTMRGKPKAIFFDKGTEFTNRLVQDYLQSEQIRIEHPDSEMKAAIAERFNRTLQGLIHRYKTENQTHRFVDVLDDLVHSYNSRGHRTLKYMSPADAEKEKNQNKVLSAHNERYEDILRKKKKPKYVVGQRVRIKTLDGRFARGYHQTFSQEHFEIVKVKKNMPIPMYILKSLNDEEEITGGFYAEELQPITTNNVFKVEKVLQKKRIDGRTQLLVKWQGWDERHNSWIDASAVTKRY